VSLLRVNGTQVMSYRPDGTDVRWYGHTGHVNQLKYSFVTPGGPDKLSFNLMTEASQRTQVLDPGRIVEAYRGGGKIWEGILGEAVPTPQGWQVSATGAGQYGANYVAAYTDMWPTSQPDESINQAIGRGLRWDNLGVGTPGMWLGASGSATGPGGGHTMCSTTIPAGTWDVTWIVGFTGSSSGSAAAADDNNFGLYLGGSLKATASVDAVNNGLELYVQSPVTITAGSSSTLSVKTLGAWLGQQVDSAAQSVTSLMNLCCTYGGLTWWVNTTQHGNFLSLMPLPTVPDRILVATDPVPRTINGQPTTVFERYELTADVMNGTGTAQVATYDTTSSIDQPSADAYGATEVFIDLSQAGVMPAAAAEAAGTNLLARFLRASFSGQFRAGPGQLLTLGGQPVDLGSETSLHVYKLVLTDFGYGGEQTLLPPITFLGGAVEFDDDQENLLVTPFQYLASDMSSLLSAAAAVLPTAFQDS
jgi:hypothetical protein